MAEHQTYSKAKYFYFLAGFCLATVLTIVYSGGWQSMKTGRPELKVNDNPLHSRIPGKLHTPDDVLDEASSGELQFQQHHGGNFTHLISSDDWGHVSEGDPTIEAYDNPTLLDGTYRDDVRTNAHKKYNGMLPRRIRDNYTYCSGIAPFLGPYPYLAETKNPCWYIDNVLHCVPYFFLAGFSKSGTSDLFFRLSHHRQVVKTWKEKHWLDYSRYFKTRDNIETYTGLFKRFTSAVEENIVDNGYSDLIVGDGTPCYAWFNFYWRCYEGNQGLYAPRFTNADVLYRLNPKAKIIFMLREPASRLYSRYLTWVGRLDHKAYKTPSPSAFHSLAANAVNLFQKCVKRWSVRHCAYNGTLYTQMSLRLQEGIYSVFLEDWLKVFPRNQILVLRFEDYVKDMPNKLKKILDFLNIDKLPSSEVLEIVSKDTRNKGKHYNIGQMLDSTRTLLRTFYKPFNKVLPGLLGDETMQWTETQS